MITLYDHPFSPYAQKVKISLREKGLAFEAPMPGGLGAGGAQGAFPVTEALAREILSLPMYPELSEDQIGRVAEAIADFAVARC